MGKEVRELRGGGNRTATYINECRYPAISWPRAPPRPSTRPYASPPCAVDSLAVLQARWAAYLTGSGRHPADVACLIFTLS